MFELRIHAQPIEDAQPLRKHRERSGTHEQVLQKLEQQSLERLVLSKVARWTMQSRRFAIALVQDGVVAAANPAWRELEGHALREWEDLGPESVRFGSLEEALLAAAQALPREPSSAAGPSLARIGDGLRIRLSVERTEAETVLAVAQEEPGQGPREHRARNHLAAALLHLRLLQAEVDPGPAASRRAGTIGELIQLAAKALESPPR